MKDGNGGPVPTLSKALQSPPIFHLNFLSLPSPVFPLPLFPSLPLSPITIFLSFPSPCSPLCHPLLSLFFSPYIFFPILSSPYLSPFAYPSPLKYYIFIDKK